MPHGSTIAIIFHHIIEANNARFFRDFRLIIKEQAVDLIAEICENRKRKKPDLP